MQQRIVAAIFESPSRAERAVAELRKAGVRDDRISIVGLSDGTQDEKQGDHVARALEHDDATGGILKGVAAGGTLGAVAGLIALSIPGLGPFIATGAIGQALGTAGSAAVLSGAVGAAAGGLTAALIDYGIDGEEAERIVRKIREGGALVTVDTERSARGFAAVRAVLHAAGGQTSDKERTPA